MDGPLASIRFILLFILASSVPCVQMRLQCPTGNVLCVNTIHDTISQTLNIPTREGNHITR